VKTRQDEPLHTVKSRDDGQYQVIDPNGMIVRVRPFKEEAQRVADQLDREWKRRNAK
jgi:hypothetical protein